MFLVSTLIELLGAALITAGVTISLGLGAGLIIAGILTIAGSYLASRGVSE
jgi:hypothetical protein